MALLLLPVTLAILSVSSSHDTIKVDWSTGVDHENCLYDAGGPPCKTISFAVQGLKNETDIILISGEQHLGSESVTVSSVNNVRIIGANTYIDCSDNNTAAPDGLVFNEVVNVTITNITFSNCGSFNNASLNSVIHFVNSSIIHLSNLILNNSKYRAVSFLDVAGEVLIRNCDFEHSNHTGVLINFTGTYDSYDTLQKANYQINNCSFISNGHFTSNRSEPHKIDGGGLHILFHGSTSYKSFEIIRSDFSGNQADSGGALTLCFYDYASNNSVKFQHLIAHNNTAHHEGGGIKVNLNGMNAVNNSIEFVDTDFTGNTAQIGGGGVIKSTKTLDYQNTFELNNSKWYNNTASFAGAALTLYPIFFPEREEDILLGKFVNVFIMNSEFFENEIGTNNVSSSSNTGSVYIGIGVIFSDSIALHISGIVTFKDNIGSSIYTTTRAHIHVHNNTVLSFVNNIAVKGAALGLMDGSHVTVYENTTLNFTGNKASEAGGAIYYTLRNYMDYFHLKHCFIRYYKPIPPAEWIGVNITFSENRADGYGNIIFASSLLPCSRYYNMSDDVTEFVYGSLGLFHFDDHYVNDKANVSTDAARMSRTDDSNKQVAIFPGMLELLPINTTDELGNLISSPVLLATCGRRSNENCPIRNKTQYITNNAIEFKILNDELISITNESDPNSQERFEFPLRLNTRSTQEIEMAINITVQECPVGFRLHLDKGICVCDINDVNGNKLPGLIACNVTQSNHQLVTKVDFWVGCVQNNNSNMMSNDCPAGYCDYGNQTNGLMYSNESDCSKVTPCVANRKGQLCGDCMGNSSVLFHSSRFKCYNCKAFNYGFILYFLSELVPLTLFFCIIIAFDISLTSGPLSSFVFFAQVLDIFDVTAYAGYKMPNPITKLSIVYRFIFGFFNLDFFRLDELSFCIHQSANTLDILAIKFGTTLYAFLLMCSILLIMRFRLCQKLIGKFRKKSSNTANYNIMNGLVAFVVVTYSQCAKVSFEILAITKLHAYNPDDTFNVVQLAGHIKFLSKQHLKYAIPAFFMIVYLAFVPLALIAHSLYFVCMKFVCVRKLNDRCCPHSRRLSKLNMYIMPIMDAFQSSYKEDGRVFAGLLFLYRFIICIAFALPTNSLTCYTLLEGILIIMLAVRTIFHPFHSRVDNAVESLLFTNLAIINGLTVYNIMFQVEYTVANRAVTTSLAYFQFLLIFTPVIIAVFIVIIKLVRYCKRRRSIGYARVYFDDHVSTKNERSIFNDSVKSDTTLQSADDELPARLIEEENMRKQATWTVVGVINDESAQLVEPKKSYGGVEPNTY